MHGKSAFLRIASFMIGSILVYAVGHPALGAEANITRTNWVERSITNLIEIKMPRNVFVTEYRTNWVERVTTNAVNVYATNHLTRTLTNKVGIELIQTNFVDLYKTNVLARTFTNKVLEIRVPRDVFVTDYRTNWVSRVLTNEVKVSYATNLLTRTFTNKVQVALVQTNFVQVYRTNLQTMTLTNEVAVNLVRTNLLERYRTNWQTLTFTNWQTVLVMKTNWVTQQVTNEVQFDAPATASVAAATAARKETGSEKETPAVSEAKDEPSVAVATFTDSLVMEAARTRRPPANNLAEVRLKVRWTGEGSSPLQVQRWRIEREDGAILCFGQDAEFKRELPVGKYKVEVRAHREGNSALYAARGALAVMDYDAVVQQKAAGKR